MDKLSLEEEGSGVKQEAAVASLVAAGQNQKKLTGGRRGGLLINPDQVAALQKQMISDDVDKLLCGK